MSYNFKHYAIITGSRSGSTHLCDLINSTNRLGRPDEYFNSDMRPYYEAHVFPQTKQSYIDKITWFTKKDNFVVGVKLNHINHIYSAYEEGYLDKVGYWIWLRRSDKILQAISRYRAWTTGAWDWTLNKSEFPATLEYSSDKIKNALASIIEEEKWMELFLRDKKVMEIYYESDIVNTADQTIHAMLEFMDVPTNDLPPLVSAQKVMRDEINLAWKERFENETKEIVLWRR